MCPPPRLTKTILSRRRSTECHLENLETGVWTRAVDQCWDTYLTFLTRAKLWDRLPAPPSSTQASCGP